ncbi:MAG: peptide deformylase [Fusobacteria bacterium]|nr:peptide deformylase [Fusobacteriota bacterium]
MEMKIRTYGDPVLRKKSEKIDDINEELLELIEYMKKTMYSASGIGLAAPQVGINKRLFIIDIGEGIKTIINPEFIESNSSIIEMEEGCLSIPGTYKKVKRPEKVTVKYLNEKGEEIIEEADGIYARALQHENDHLDGIMFVDRLSTVGKKLVSKKLDAIKKETLKNL